MKYLKTYKQLFEKRVSKDEKIDIYRDADYIVVAPLTHLASCKYGTDTGWCISVPSASYVWDEGFDEDNAKIVFIINKRFQGDDEKISRLENLNYKKENDELGDDEMEEFSELYHSHEGEDLSKIALIYYKKNKGVEIWDANNINIEEAYQYDGYFGLPIKQEVLQAIENYFES
jgi:hypothetical protein